ncbi:MAG: hypothetical protein ACOY31_11245 [Bacillota bacterium]
MNLKSIIRLLANLIYVVFIGYIIIWGAEYLNHLRKIVGQTYIMPYHYLLLNAFFPVIIGMLMALPGLIKTLKKPGPWQLDWVILLSVGLPTFFVAILPWAYFFTPIWKISDLIHLNLDGSPCTSHCEWTGVWLFTLITAGKS